MFRKKKYVKCLQFIFLFKLNVYICYIKMKQLKKIEIMTTDLIKNWNKLERAEKLEVIENAIDMCNTNEGFLMLRFWAKDNSITAHIQTKLDNHLCTEAVSQDTLFSFFGSDYDFQEEDAEVILTWMENQI